MKTTRRAFLRQLGIGVAATAVLPKLLPALLPASGGIVAEPVRLITSCTLISVDLARDAPHIADILINREPHTGIIRLVP